MYRYGYSIATVLDHTSTALTETKFGKVLKHSQFGILSTLVQVKKQTVTFLRSLMDDSVCTRFEKCWSISFLSTK